MKNMTIAEALAVAEHDHPEPHQASQALRIMRKEITELASMLNTGKSLMAETIVQTESVTDAMVEAACEGFEGAYHWAFLHENVRANTRVSMKCALEAVVHPRAKAITHG